MSGTVAGTIQGESNGTTESMFAVASTIYNRKLAGTFPGGTDALSIVNAPNQYTGHSSNPSDAAQTFAGAIEAGTLPQYGNPGTVTEFRSADYVANHPNSVVAGGAEIGGNVFTESNGNPGVAPVFGGGLDPGNPTNPPGTENIGSFGVDQAALADPSGGFIPSASDTRLTGQQIDPSQFGDTGGAGGNVIGPDGQTITPQSGSGGQLVYNPQKPEQNVTVPPATSSLGIAGKIPDVANAISSGFGALGDNIVKKVSDGVASLEAYAGRGLVMVLAIVLFLVAAWLMVPRETKTRIISTAGTAAKAAA